MKILSYLLLLVFGFTPAVTNAASADDAAIDQVMDRIASGFKAGDDSYSVEVMYRPLLEMLGGKEILLEAGKKSRTNEGSKYEGDHVEDNKALSACVHKEASIRNYSL